MAYIKSLRDATLKINDGGANTLTIALDEGDLSIKETRNVVEILDRGALHEIKLGDEAPLEVSFSMKFVSYRTGGLTPYDFLTKTGTAAAYTTTRATTNVWCVDLVWTTLAVGGGTDENITLSDFFVTDITVAEGDPTTMSVTGKAWATAPAIT